MQTLEFKDFSGGITDKNIPGVSNRYGVADNLLIDNDKRIYSRDAFGIFSSTAYQVGTAERISRLVNFDSDSEIIALHNKKLEYISAGAWASLAGPTANNPFNTNSSASLISEAQWNHHLFLASDSGDPVIKVYRDGSNALQLRTAGMPNMASSLTPMDGGLALGITLANDLLSKMQTHMASNAAVAATGPNNSATGHHVSGGGLATSATNLGALSNSTNLANLISNLIVMRTEYTRHITDAQQEIGLPGVVGVTPQIRANHISPPYNAGSYLVNAAAVPSSFTLSGTTNTNTTINMASTTGIVVGMNISGTGVPLNTQVTAIVVNTSITINNAATASATVTLTFSSASQTAYYYRHFLNYSLKDATYTIVNSATIDQVLLYLNDLRDKWNWHAYAPLTHYNAYRFGTIEYYTGLGAHKTSISKVVPYSWADISPNYDSFIQYIKDIKTEYDAHLASDAHALADTVNAIPAGYPTSPANIHEAITLFNAISFFSYLHLGDALSTNITGYGASYYQITADSTGVDPDFTTLSNISANPALTLSTNWRLCNFRSPTSASPFTWTMDRLGTEFPSGKNGYFYRISTHPGTYSISFSNVLGFTDTANQFVFTNCKFHFGAQTASVFNFKNHYNNLFNLDYTFPTAAGLQLLSDYAKNLIDAIKVHALSGKAQPTTTNSSLYQQMSVGGKVLDAYYYNAALTQPISTGTDGYNVLAHYGNDTVRSNGIAGAGNFGGYAIGLGQTYWPQSTGTSFFAQTKFTDDLPTAVSINYRSVFKYDYIVGTTSFTDRGVPSDPINIITFQNVLKGGSSEIGKYATVLANVYAYTNASNENFATSDTTNFRKEIYRTIGNGSVYFKVNVDGSGGDIANATTSLSDYSVDSELVNQLSLYTNGGVQSNGKPPIATYIHTLNGFMYYAIKNKLYQSMQDDLDSVNENFFDQFEKDLTGISSTRSNVIVFTKDEVIRVTGNFNVLGQGGMSHATIFGRTGCVAPQSIVKTDVGVFFAGKDGFYFTDGVQCFRVTDLEDTFISFTATTALRNRIQGSYDSITKKIYWTIPANANLTYPTKIWVLDLKFGIFPDLTPVTTFSGDSSFNPTALAFYLGVVHYGDNDGYVFAQVKDSYLDYKKDTAVAATSWSRKTIMWDFKSCHSDCGSAKERKYFLRVTPQFDQVTNLSAQIVSDADKGKYLNNLPVIRSRKLTDWGDSKLDWIASVYTAKEGGVIDEFRRFNASGSLRSNFRAIEMKNAYCVIVNSTDMGLLNVSSQISTHVWALTLVNSGTRKWPLYSVDYYVRINSVDYPVIVRTSDSVVRVDDTGLAALSLQTGLSWEMWGYPKNERMRLLSYYVGFDFLGDKNQKAYEGATTDGGENA